MYDKLTYRGYEIEQSGDKWAVSKDGQPCATFASEDAAMNFVDGEKRKQRSAVG